MPAEDSQKASALVRIDKMLEIGGEIRSLRQELVEQGGGGVVTPEHLASKFRAWKSRGEEFLQSLLGDRAPTLVAFASCEVEGVEDGLALFTQLRKDIEAGELTKVESRLAGEVLSELLKQSKYLQMENCHAAAVILAGAVLERAVKTLTSQYGLEVNATKFAAHNQALQKRGVYDQALWRRLEACYELGNSVARGKTIPKRDDARPMIEDISGFVATYFG